MAFGMSHRGQEYIAGNIGSPLEGFGCPATVWAVRIGKLDNLFGAIADFHRLVKRQVFQFLKSLRLQLGFQLTFLVTGQVLSGQSINIADKKQIFFRIEEKDILPGNNLVKPLDITCA